MSSFVGADPADLKALAGRLSSSAQAVEQLRERLDGLVYVADWQGSVADQFKSSWIGRHSPVMSSAAQLLQSTSKKILFEAEQQVNASASSSRSAVTLPRQGWLSRVALDVGSAAHDELHATERALEGARHIADLGAVAAVDELRKEAEGAHAVAVDVSRYANDVSNIVNRAAPFVTVAAVLVMVASVATADPVGFAAGVDLLELPSEVGTASGALGAGSAGVAVATDEVADIPESQKAAQLRVDLPTFTNSVVSVGLDATSGKLDDAVSTIPGLEDVPAVLMDNGPTNPVQTVVSFTVHDEVLPAAQSFVQQKLDGQ
jgi:hypothetical protein